MQYFAVWEPCGASRTFPKLQAAHCKTSRSFRLIPKASRLQTNNSHFLFGFLNLTDGPKWLVRPVQHALVALGRFLFFFLFFFASLRDHPHCSFSPPPDKEWILASLVVVWWRRHCEKAPLYKDKIIKPSKVTAVSVEHASPAVNLALRVLVRPPFGKTHCLGVFFFFQQKRRNARFGLCVTNHQTAGIPRQRHSNRPWESLVKPARGREQEPSRDETRRDCGV